MSSNRGREAEGQDESIHSDDVAKVDRRTGLDRRKLARGESGYQGPERRAAEGESGLELHRGPGKRRAEDRRSAEEGEMTAEQFEFVKAIETYKKVNKRMYPTWTEVLDVLRQLGYRKVQAREIVLENVPEPTLWQGEEKKAA
jgi:hypothetical protein